MDTILPVTFWALLDSFQGVFSAPSFRNFRTIVAGWVQCLGRHTITATVLAAGAVGQCHISVFHRFFSRAEWVLDKLGAVLFQLAIAWLAADQPLLIVLDDTLARKHGKCISLASMHYDPLLSTTHKAFCSFGHVWVVLAVWVPLPLGHQRGFALPVLFRLYVGRKRGGQADAPSRRTTGRRQQAAQQAAAARPYQTKLELARELVGVLAGWAGERSIYVVADSAYAGRTILERRPANVEVISRLRMDAALWTSPPARRPGQQGRPRRRGMRLPTPATMARARRSWQSLSVDLYGRLVTVPVFHVTALWYVALRDQPVRVVIVRDPSGRRKDEAFLCTDRQATAAFILESYARRWSLEVAFHDGKQHLGFEDPQNQAAKAVQRTAPLAFVVYDLVLLWAAGRAQQGLAGCWVDRPWYRRKTAPSFMDLLTVLRLEAWRNRLFDPAWPARRLKNAPPPWAQSMLATA